MKKLKKFFDVKCITKIVMIYILIQPILDIFSFLNIRGYMPGISTYLKPLVVFGLGIYVFCIDKKSRKKYIIPYGLFSLLMLVHSLCLRELGVENSVIFHEIRFMINFAYMLVLFMIFEYVYKNNENKDKFINDLKKVVAIVFVAYCITILIAILTGTSAKTYEYADASKSGFKGWLDSGQIFGHSLCIFFPFLICFLFKGVSNKKSLNIIGRISVLFLVVVLTLLGTKVSYFLDVAVLGTHFIVDLIIACRDKNKKSLISAIICMIICIALISVYRYLPVKKNIDINNGVLNTDISTRDDLTETNREDLEKINTIVSENTVKTENIQKYLESDLQASKKLEEKYESGELHPSDMRNRQLIYNFEKYMHAPLIYKFFGIGYLNQSNYLSLERDSIMLLFSFGIIGVVTILLKPIIIWFKSVFIILKNITKVQDETLYLFEGLSLFFCISIYAGYTFIYTNFSIYLVILCILLQNSLETYDGFNFKRYWKKGKKSKTDVKED